MKTTAHDERLNWQNPLVTDSYRDLRGGDDCGCGIIVVSEEIWLAAGLSFLPRTRRVLARVINALAGITLMLGTGLIIEQLIHRTTTAIAVMLGER